MEERHYTSKQRKDGYFVLTPDKGYIMTNGRESHTKVVTKEPDGWWAVKDAVDWEAYEEQLK